MGRGQNGIGNRELKELLSTTHGCELREMDVGRLGGAGWRGDKGKKFGKTVITQSIKYNFKKRGLVKI